MKIKDLIQGVAEVSDDTLIGYLTKVDADARKHKMDPTKRDPEKSSKSAMGFSRAFNKLDARPRKEQGVAEDASTAMSNVADRLANKDDGRVAKLRAAGDKRREEHLKGRDIANRDRTSKDEWGNLKFDEEKQRLDPSCWAGYKKDGTKIKSGVRVNNCVKEELEETYDGDEFFEAYGELWYNEDEQLDEADYHGRSVPLGKPMQGDVKKFKVYVKDPSTGNVKKVNFGDPNMKIRKSNPAARRSFRARHNCDNPGPRTMARYWSCRAW